MTRAKISILALMLTIAAAQAQPLALAPQPAPAPVPAQPPPQSTTLPAPPVAAPFGALYNTISGRAGAANCTPGLTPFNSSTCH
jgi:hypothetical protein